MANFPISAVPSFTPRSPESQQLPASTVARRFAAQRFECLRYNACNLEWFCQHHINTLSLPDPTEKGAAWYYDQAHVQ